MNSKFILLITLSYFSAINCQTTWTSQKSKTDNAQWLTLSTYVAGYRRSNVIESGVGTVGSANGYGITAVTGPSCTIGDSESYFIVDLSPSVLSFCVGFVVDEVYYADAYTTSNGLLSEAAEKLGGILDSTFKDKEASFIHFCTYEGCNAYHYYGLVRQSSYNTDTQAGGSVTSAPVTTVTTATVTTATVTTATATTVTSTTATTVTATTVTATTVTSTTATTVTSTTATTVTATTVTSTTATTVTSTTVTSTTVTSTTVTSTTVTSTTITSTTITSTTTI